MRLVYLTAAYPAYIRDFYGRNNTIELESYDYQLAALDRHAFAWVGAWRDALRPFGYDVDEVLCNIGPLQRTWAWEVDRSLFGPDELNRIAVEQVRRLQPDILFFDHHDTALLGAIKAASSRPRLVIGWVGSAIPPEVDWRQYDTVLSCAPESVEWLTARGVPSAHMHHGFNDAVLRDLEVRPKEIDVAFFGQIVTAGSSHGARERLLEELVDAGIDVQIFSPSFDYGRKADLIAMAKSGIWHMVQALRQLRVPDAAIRRLPIVRRGLFWPERPSAPVSRKLRPHLRPGRYGVDLFQAIADSRLTLNIHADSSPRFASNMRLFETTGVAGCLLTDWKENLGELFEPDKEVVTYRSTAECIEKIHWLLDHPDITAAAQQRVLKDHTYARRAERLHDVIKQQLQRAKA